MPFSISSMGLYSTLSVLPLIWQRPLVFDRSWWHQVCEPTACPPAATCLRMLGSYVACRPIGKKIALVQCAASAASTAGVFFGHGPSSKVSTTSPSRRKSCALKCSKPKPGPPVVSISTTRETPSALGLLHEAGMAEGGGAAAWATAAGASAARADPAAGFMSVTAATGARPSVGVTWAGWGAGTGLFCQKMAPNTATHSTIASADAIVARRMSDPPNWGPKAQRMQWTEVSTHIP